MLRNAYLSLLILLLLLPACGEMDDSDPSGNSDPSGLAEAITSETDSTFQAAATPAPGTIVYRVNAGGPSMAATNGGPAWSQDTAGSPSAFGNAAAAGSAVYSTSESINTSDPSLPAGTPAALFQLERWDQPAGAEMLWRFPVAPGTYEVRLYLAEIYSGAYAVGARKFDVYAEGQLRLDDVDVYRDAGARKGIVKKFSVTADASLDIEFRHVAQNPAVKAIEIVYTGGGSTTPPPGGTVSTRYRINSGGPGITASDGGPNWAADSAGSVSSFCNGGQTGNQTFSTTRSINMTDASLPAGTPQALFQTERYDLPALPDLQCNFPVSPGNYEVRLYFAEIYDGALATGARVFNVYLEGGLVFNRLDVFAAIGGYKALVKKAVVASDSVLTVRLASITEHAALKGIEVLPAGGSTPTPPPPPPPPPPSGAGLRLNQFQVKNTHNSYHLRPTTYNSAYEYDMPTLTNQLNLYGVRGFELDLHWSGYFSVYHWPVDPNSTCPALTQCLAELRAWSDAHPNHMPLFVFLDLKYDTPGDNVFNHLEEIDKVIDNYWPRSRIYTPDDLTGGAGQVQDAMRSRGWPTIDSVRGKIIFSLQVEDAVGKRYANNGTGLQGKRMFVASGNTSLPWVVITLFDDTALARSAVNGGFIVRTRADVEPTMGETSPTRFARTLASGAHLITTDYPIPYTLPGYDTTIPGGTPARCNPVTAPSTCVSSQIE